MLTEDEAKKRWCPFARIVGGKPRDDGSCDVALGQAAFNRTNQYPRTVSFPDAAMCSIREIYGDTGWCQPIVDG